VDLDTANFLAKLALPYCVSVGVYGRAQGPFPDVSCVQAVEFAAKPIVPTVVAVRIRGPEDARRLIANPPAGTVVLDAFSEAAFGGTGKTIDWRLAAEIVRNLSTRVVLAGGLTPDNVGSAIAEVRPYAVDVSSGVESAPGIKDVSRLKAFFAAVREADQATLGTLEK
jgi:phosphoribosylanthranilate isomerase